MLRSFIKAATVFAGLFTSAFAADAPPPFKDASCSVTFYQLPEKNAQEYIIAETRKLVGQTSGCRAVWEADVYFRPGHDAAEKTILGTFDPRQSILKIKFNAAALQKVLAAK